MRRFHEKVAAGAVVPPIPEGERGVSFVLEQSDLNAFQRYHSPSPLRTYLRPFLMIVALVVASLVLMKVFGGPPVPARPAIRHTAADFWLSIFLSLILPLLVFVAFWILFLRQAMGQNAKGGVFEPITVSISPEFLTGREAESEGKTRWSAVESVRLHREHIVVLFRNGTANIIPRWAFADAADAEFFYAEMHGYWEKAKK